MHQAIVGPGIGDAQELPVKAPVGARVEIGTRNPQQCLAGRARGDSARGSKNRPLSSARWRKQLPVVAARLLELAGFLVVILRKVLLAHQAAEGVRGQAEA